MTLIEKVNYSILISAFLIGFVSGGALSYFISSYTSKPDRRNE
jgi:uncharacterized membrane protein YoaK (UPF0700 family)